MPNNRNLQRFLKPDVKLASNGFPLERRDVFSTKVGLLNLASIIPTVPNDYFELDPTVFIQTDRFNVANFTRMSQHLDFFYVPMTAIQSRYNEWYQQTVDPSNAIFDMNPLTDEQSEKFVPSFHLQSLVWALAYANCVYHYNDYSEFVAQYPDADTTDIGFGLINYLANTQIDGINLSSVYQNLFLDVSIPPYKLALDKLGYPLFLNCIRLLDMAGYGNLLPLINMPIFTFNIDSYASSSSYSEAIADTASDFITMLKSLDKHVNVYSLAAYQSVCHNYFCNPHFERPSVVSYNFDDFNTTQDFVQHRVVQGGLPSSQNSHVEYYRGLFTMNYTPWKKDIYLSALPSPQFGDVSVVTVLSDVLRNTSGSNVGGFPSSGQQIVTKNNGKFGINSNLTQLSSTFSTLDLVKANALQYWKQQIGRAGFRTADRYRATFGSAPVHETRVMPTPIGSLYSSINKEQIIGSAGEDFGEKRATGSSLINNRKIKFSSPNEFGFIVAIHRILPESDYDAYMIDKQNTKFAPFDFFTPAFQNLGLEALDVSELSIYNEAFYYNSSDILGYVPRYHEYKTCVDKVHGEFCNMPLSLLRHNSPTNPNTHSGLTVPTVGVFSSFVSTRIDLQSFIGSVRQFYVDPAIVDNLFLVSADGEQNTDQFWITSYIDVKSYRSMSILGLPQF